MSEHQQQMSQEDQAIQQIRKGFAETVLFDMSEKFGSSVTVNYRECTLEDLAGEQGIYGILSHELQTLVGVTSDPEYLLKNHAFGSPESSHSIDQESWENEHFPPSKKRS